jgi:hypothetical protein
VDVAAGVPAVARAHGAGSLRGLPLVVPDIEEAGTELVDKGVDVE